MQRPSPASSWARWSPYARNRFARVSTIGKDLEIEGTDLKLGQRVTHAKFGEGVVVNYEGEGKQARVQVNFVDEGSKWLMTAYAKLEPVP